MQRPEPRDPVSLTMWGFGAAALFWAIVQPWWSFPWETLTGVGYPLGAEGASVPIWALCTYMVVLGTVVPFWLIVVSLHHIRASQASVIGMTEPLLASFIAWVALGEVLTPVQLLGAVVVLVGVFLAERYRTCHHCRAAGCGRLCATETQPRPSSQRAGRWRQARRTKGSPTGSSLDSTHTPLGWVNSAKPSMPFSRP